MDLSNSTNVKTFTSSLPNGNFYVTIPTRPSQTGVPIPSIPASPTCPHCGRCPHCGQRAYTQYSYDPIGLYDPNQVPVYNTFGTDITPFC